ncbi:MAG: hypothetical protein PSX36_01960 [bacterium]|nr:hypothetical protein [bacterium]
MNADSTLATESIHNKPRPYANKSIIYLSEKGRIDSASTDAEGSLTLKLRKGTYHLFETWRYYLYTPLNLPFSAFDRACMIKEWEKYLYTITVLRRSYKTVQTNLLVELCEENIPCLLQRP